MKLRMKTLLLTGIIAGLLVAGCNGKTEKTTDEAVEKNASTKSTAAPDEIQTKGIVLTEVISKEEISNTVGFTVGDPEQETPDNALGQQVVVWSGQGSSSTSFVQISLIDDAGIGSGAKAGGTSAKSLFDSLNQPDAQAESGIGDEAYSGMLGVSFLKGSAYAVVIVSKGQDEVNHEAEIALAKALAEKL